MVVVTIVGILAAIGIPQYSKFQAKTRQSEAKGSLSVLYTSETGFQSEWNQFTVDLHNVGFGVTGSSLHYITGFQYGIGCTNYTATNGAPPEQFAIDDTTSCGVNINLPTVNQATWTLPNPNVTIVANRCTAILPAAFVPVTITWTASACDATAGSQSFTAAAVGDPNSNIGNVFLDGWTINQNKHFVNTDFGIQ